MFQDSEKKMFEHREHEEWIPCAPILPGIERDIVSKVKIIRMKNMDLKIEGSTLTVTVDLSKDFGESKSGKSITIASSEGNISIPGQDDIKIGLNIYRKKE